MHKLFDIIERHGFIGVQDAEKVYELPAGKLGKLHREVFDHIYKRQDERIWSHRVPPPSAFSFHAGASIRGAWGCRELGCRLQKLDFLARYSALYANELTLPLAMPNPNAGYDNEEIRYCLELDLVCLLFLRPLVTAGLVVPVVMRTSHCVHEHDWIRKLTSLAHDFSQATGRFRESEFSLRYQIPQKSPSGKPSIYLEGPDQYIPHGGFAKNFDRKPRWLPRSMRFNKQGLAEIRGQYKQHLLSQIFTMIADNVTFYFSYGLKRQARFLTDMRGETDFLDWMTSDDEEMTAKTDLLRELQHTVPVLGELPIGTILRIRQQEKDAFENYRATVTKMSSNILTSKNVSKKEVRQMLRDAIEPELRKMSRDLRTYRKVRRSQSIGAAVWTAAGVILGAYAGLPPIASVPLAGGAGVVGGRLAAKAAEEACSHGPDFKQKNDLYFLLRLTNEAE